MRKELKFIALFIALPLIYHWDALLRGLLLAPGDGIFEFYPLRVVIRDMVAQGAFPFWNPYMFIGFPLLGSMQAGALYPLNYLFLPLPPEIGFNLTVLLHTALAGYFMFLYARLITGRDMPSVVAGIAFAFLGFVPAHLQHTPMQASAVWLPLMLYFIEKLRSSGDLKHAVMASFALALQIYSGHPQTVMQSVLFCGLYVALLAPGMGRSGAFFALKWLVSAILGLVLALPQLVSTAELSGLAYRAELRYEIFSMMSFPPHMLPSMLMPGFWGTGGGYWGPPDMVKDIEGYAGPLAVVVGMAALIKYWRDRRVRTLGIIAAVAFALALGDYLPFLNKIIYRIPVLNLFRAPVRHFFEIDLALAALLAVGLSKLEERDESFRKTALIALGALLSAVVLLSVAVNVIPFKVPFELMAPGRFPSALRLDSPAVYVPLVFISSYLLALFFIPRARRASLVIGVVALVLFAESFYYRSLYRPNLPIIADIKVEAESFPVRYLREGGGRSAFVFASTGESIQETLPMAFGIKMLNGYDPLILKDFSDLLDMESIGYSHSWPGLITNNVLLSALGTRYLILPKDYGLIAEQILGRVSPENQFVAPIGSGLPPSDDYKPIYRKFMPSPKGAIYVNRNVLPRAVSVRRVLPAGDISGIGRMFYAFRVNPREEALLSKDDIESLGRTDFAHGAVDITVDEPNRVVLETDFPGEGFLVLADQHYPGWKAYVDGKETKIYKANGIMRGVVVPGGKRAVAFKYVPVRIYASMAVSALALAVSIAYLARRKKAQSSDTLPDA